MRYTNQTGYKNNENNVLKLSKLARLNHNFEDLFLRGWRLTGGGWVGRGFALTFNWFENRGTKQVG